MGAQQGKTKENKSKKNNASFRCIYEIKDYSDTQIINDRDENNMNEEIKTKVKILNDKKKENIIL